MAPRTPRNPKTSAPANTDDGEQPINVPPEETPQANLADDTDTRAMQLVASKDPPGSMVAEGEKETQAAPLVFAATKNDGLTVVPSEGDPGGSLPPTTVA